MLNMSNFKAKFKPCNTLNIVEYSCNTHTPFGWQISSAGAVPFQKVHFCTLRVHIGTLMIHIST